MAEAGSTLLHEGRNNVAERSGSDKPERESTLAGQAPNEQVDSEPLVSEEITPSLKPITRLRLPPRPSGMPKQPCCTPAPGCLKESM
jgi:hypothetical protein